MLTRRQVIGAGVGAAVAALAFLICLPAAYARRFHGGTTASSDLALSGSPADATVGSAYSQALTASGGSGTGYTCNQVSATPNTGLWLYITPGCTLEGTPQAAETESIIEQVTDSIGDTAQTSFTFVASSSGSLSVVSSATLPDAVSGGYYAYPIIIEGGAPPYSCSGYATQPWQITPDCLVEGTPTSTGSVSFSTQTITDSLGATTTYTPSLTVGSVLTIAGVDAVTGLLRLPPAIAGNYYQAQLNGAGGSGSGYSYTATSGLPAWATETSGGLISGTPTVSGGVTIAEKLTDSAANTATASALLNVANADTASVPDWDTDGSFFVSSGKLYDGTGHRFIMRGLNRVHFNSTSWASDASGALSGANAVREFAGFGFSDQGDNQTPAQMAAQVTDEYTDNAILPIVTVSSIPSSVTETAMTATSFGNTTTVTVSALAATSTGSAGILALGSTVDTGITCTGNASAVLTAGPSDGLTGTYTISVGGTSGSCSGSAGTVEWSASLSGNEDPNAIVGASNMLVYALANGLSDIQPDIAINLANEWGCNVVLVESCTNTAPQWQSTYETAVAALRTAGFTGPITIDSLNDAEDTTILTGGYAAAVLAADSEHNVIFSFHLYGSTYTTGSRYYQTLISQLADYQGMGIPVLIEEYGPPGLNSTTVALSAFRASAVAYGVPDLEWAWDDGPSPMTWAGGFGDAGVGMGNSKGDYVRSTPSMLSAPGMDVLLNPVTGLMQQGVPATGLQ